MKGKDMAIIRIHTNEQYTAMSNHHLRDTSLTLQAMGLLSFMLSCSDKFKFSIEGLTKCSGSGETATRTALMELRNKGYVVVSRTTNEHGKVAEWVYDIFETPHVEKPDVENPHVENPVVDNQGQRNNKISTINERTLFGEESPLKVNNESISIEVVDEQFEKFWALYDKKVERAQAKRMWKRLKASEKDEVMHKVALYVASTPDKQYRMNPSTYLNPVNKRWQDEIRYHDDPRTKNNVVVV